jgi:hypothetical protein
VLAFSWPLAAACSVQLEKYGKENNGGWWRIRTMLRPQTWAVCAVCIVIMLNAFHVFAMSREIARIVSPVKASIKTVREFYKTSRGVKQLYVDFVPRNLDNKLFGGTHIALETCFANSGILTRHVAKAEYVYERPDGIIANPAFASQKAIDTDFTIEFDYVMWGPLITVINSPENTLRIRQLSPAENELLLRLTHLFEGRPQEIYVTAKHPRHYVSHVVIQREGDRIYVVEEGRLIAVKLIGQGEVFWQDDMLFLGARVVFPPQYCYLENFFACVGKAKYDLEGMAVGDLAPDKGLRAPMPALNSDPLYWSTVRKRSFWG